MSRRYRPEDFAETDIAVVGMAGRFPGAQDVSEYWDNLRDGVESIQQFSVEELEAAGVDPELLRNPAYVRSAATLEGYDQFDAGFFGVGAKDAAIMDPQQRIFLECAWEALESGGHVPERFPGSIGVFAGCGMNSYFIHNLLTNPDLVRSVGLFLLRHTANDKDFLATTASFKLNLTGPSVSVQTACSTSLVAIHLACQSLLGGECDMALAGGSTINVPHETGYLYQEGEILSPDGHCRAFDSRSAGTLFGSGAGVVTLRRARDAAEHGDPIFAVIKGSAINNDGAAKANYLAPSVDGQALAIAEAISLAGVPAESISYVEAHGTGTALGDPIEVEALTQAFRQTTEKRSFCGIGSVKPNIGHLDTAAGVASFIKTIQALRHAELPPSIHYKEPNPAIDFASSPFYVNAKLNPWPGGKHPRRAGVSSLGVGGTNAHVVLEEAPRVEAAAASRPWQLLPISARSPEALDAAGQRLVRHLQTQPELSVADVAYTLQQGRRGFTQRAAIVAQSREQAIEVLEGGDRRKRVQGVQQGDRPSLAFLLPGGGAQYPRMGVGLYESEPVVREHIDRGFEILRGKLDRDLHELWFCAPNEVDAAARTLERPSLQLPATFLLEYALAKLWMSWGIEPDALIGHSVGENAAACLAGVMSFEDALGLVTLRGRLFEEVPEGGMLSVRLGHAELEPLLGDQLVLAAVNAPELSVASGSLEALARLEGRLQERGVDHQRIRISIAAHSPMLDPILGEFRAYLESISLQRPEIAFISNRTGTWISDEQAVDPGYWVEHLRNTVRYAEGIGTLLQVPDRVLLEVGPGRTLSSLARQHPDLTPGRPVFASMRHPEESTQDLEHLLGALGSLWCQGVEPDWNALHGTDERRRVELPTYPFERQRYWVEPGRRSVTPSEPLEALDRLHHEPEITDWFWAPQWQLAPQTGSSLGEASRWLVFVDQVGLGAALAQRLEALGQEVIVVREGDAFYRFSENEYALAPEGGRAGYELLVKELVEQDKLPQRILHLWTVTGDEGFRPGSSFFHQNQERGFWSLFFLAQALGDQAADAPIEIGVVSNGMQAVASEALAYPEKATLLGPVRVIPREFGNLYCRSIDVELPAAARSRSDGQAFASLAERLVDELSAPTAGSVVAYRGSERFEQVLERRSVSQSDTVPGLRESGVYLITGGLGGIGLRLADHLARNYRARLILVGRTGIPPRSEWDDWLDDHSDSDPTSRRIAAVRALEAAGGEVIVAAADVANIERMREVILDAANRFGEIHGVFHAAGSLEDGVIQMKSPESVERVFTAKVHGTVVLAELFEASDLDFLVLFSSTSALLGPAGQVDYVAANSFMNAFARSDAASSAGRTLALNWGIWNEVGMARDLSRRLHGEADGSDDVRTRVSHPLLDERLTDQGESQLFASRLRASDRWPLSEHRMKGGPAVMPGTGYLELARAGFQAAQGTGACELRNVTFLAPLEIAEASERQLELALTPKQESWEFEIRSHPSDGGAFELHAQGVIGETEEARPMPLDIAQIEARCPQREQPADGALTTGQSRYLAFGPRWRSLKQLAYGHHEALARIELADDFIADLDDHALHPALLDLATGYAMSLIEGYTSGHTLYVPVAYPRLKFFAPLEQKLYSHVRVQPGASVERDVVSFDVTITNELGEVLVQVDGFTIKKLADPAAQFAGERPAAGLDTTHLSATERLFLESFEAGIRAEEGMQALERVLASESQGELLVSSIDLQRLADRHAAAGSQLPDSVSVKFERPSLKTEYTAPRDELENTLVGYWEELLGIDPIGVHDDFFELGGHSLIAVRLFARIKKTYDVEFPLSILFDASTIAQCAELLREELGHEASEGEVRASRREPRHRFLVPMNEVREPGKAPFFLVSGMFGNVLNLRHLASHLGADQPVYAIQAKGLYGDEEPHRRFDDMAREYLEEVRAVQPEGPYFLGGFSGGGITAFEMAQQLRAQGQEVALLVMLDTPAPGVPSAGWLDRMQIQWQHLRREGPRYFARWARQRVRWELDRFRGRLRPVVRDVTPAEFRSEQIEAGFREALTHYQMQSYPGGIVLFRPPLRPAHVLRGSRLFNEWRELMDEENHWKPWIEGGIDVHVVTGDHDSMVLEPYVRVLGEKLHACLEQAQRRHGS